MTSTLQTRADSPRHCLVCDYNLTGLGEQPVCPECGVQAQNEQAALPLAADDSPKLEIVFGSFLLLAFGYGILASGLRTYDAFLILVVVGPMAIAGWTIYSQRRATDLISNRTGIYVVRRGGRARRFSWTVVKGVEAYPESGDLYIRGSYYRSLLYVKAARAGGSSKTLDWSDAANRFRCQAMDSLDRRDGKLWVGVAHRSFA